MGLFKDVRKLNKQAKEMAKEQGVDTSLRGLMKQAPGMLEQASQQLQQVAGRAGLENPVADLALEITMEGASRTA